MENKELAQVIAGIIDNKIRPVLQTHQGDIVFLGCDDNGVVQVRLGGNCSQCPGAQQTLSRFVQATLQAECPGVTAVTLVQQVSEALIAQALQLLRQGRCKK